MNHPNHWEQSHSGITPPPAPGFDEMFQRADARAAATRRRTAQRATALTGLAAAAALLAIVAWPRGELQKPSNAHAVIAADTALHANLSGSEFDTALLALQRRIRSADRPLLERDPFLADCARVERGIIHLVRADLDQPQFTSQPAAPAGAARSEGDP